MPTDINNFNITNFNLERCSFTFCIRLYTNYNVQVKAKREGYQGFSLMKWLNN